MKTRKLLCVTVMGSMLGLASSVALAKADAADVARLGQDLTPFGSEKAGNASGTIPAWTGGLTQAPAGFIPGKGYVDPYASDKPVYTITAANMAQYADQLTPGYKAMLQKFASYKMIVYPTHRPVGLPATEYEQIKKEAGTVALADNGAGMLNYDKTSVPFPVPKTAQELLYNHSLRYRSGGYHYFPTEMVVKPGGNFTVIHRDVTLAMASALGNPEPNRLYYYLSKVTGPDSVAGQQSLVHEPIDQVKEPRLAWQYNPGQRRVLRAPELAYDTVDGLSDGLRTLDMYDMFSGAPDRYDWQLLGKKEMIVPYDTYKLADRSLQYSDIVKPDHLNQDLIRYETHRVWVVQATLKPGARHIYAKRIFYIDEDSWAILAADLFDGRGELWRMQEAHGLQRYDVLSSIAISDVAYDLQARSYVVNGLENQEKQSSFGVHFTLQDFSPAALRRAGN
ncbi:MULTISPECIES: DUF1329 domain-containing protein [unclassified Pseudomonas]|uniref:DUF1329 domain-containing protein n=1 Tax=unclassified Pseudomonas TaxID=196821 RepID=UPI002AC8E302|nr:MULTISPECIES: DUF1329 domain-containing protein [unclassified Pseudomonas]MEB0039296.1 DUF1329 domain-containing protein [Pseudomonas sp. MH10]MEB0076056.1 DUF1329 domain-containing protein [Pseudomonas sp. MH10out]MEB0090838.1 DUF1329 domain-containing protein [Pseudomonas sp. CCI4.2]MEB0100143.1 DUF1329 domain-containing protein [Pseudomonas sp. CCI3.2]MEB0131479.1 DUF1329 domain-containing protein [Pseudomonas sp. CCI2.4]